MEIVGNRADDPMVEKRGGGRVILVDGFNVLHAVLLEADRASGWWRRAVRERLLRLAADWPDREDEIWVAFDGAQPSWSVWAEPVAQVVPVPSGTPARTGNQTVAPGSARPLVHNVHVESADDWIVRRARRARRFDRAEQTVIVTADRQVAGRGRSAGCEIWTPWSFVSKCRVAACEPARARAMPGAKSVRP